jgi:Protein of unknown function (DUF 659)/hAT family C-terminal dimerisation region
LRPAYVDSMPSASVIGGSLLNQEYELLFDQTKSFITNASHYSLVTDGWSNLRNEHIVNFVVLVPGHKPFFYKAVSTVGIAQTSQEIARVILGVVEELGISKCVAVVSDNAANMRGAWDLIEDAHPHIFANGCAAHVMNLLVKDICDLSGYSELLAEVQFLVKFVKDHQHVLARFNEFRQEFKIARTLVLSVPTRWYTQFNSCENLLKAKFAMTLLCEQDDLLSAISAKGPVKRFRDIITNGNFWSALKEITKVLSFPTSIIGKFEKDTSDLFVVYDYFMRLSQEWVGMDGLDPARALELKGIVRRRWAFIHTSSMGFAYMLTPSCSKKPWAATDKVATKKELKSYIGIYYKEPERVVDCHKELEDYLTMIGSMSPDLEEEYYSLTGQQFWSQYGKDQYPHLAKIALRLYTVPTSSAAAERVWSIYAFIHSKRRNRLGIKKVEKLAFIYINHCLLDSTDKNDYIGDDGAHSDDE